MQKIWYEASSEVFMILSEKKIYMISLKDVMLLISVSPIKILKVVYDRYILL